uniref:Uncharacterized protein n=1 Tax=Theropithecus gelada TaxID=9565 RepID=A0A8D2GBC5_THEGE
MASSSVPPATVPAATAGPGPGFGFASKTKKKHFVQQKVKVFRAEYLYLDQFWSFQEDGGLKCGNFPYSLDVCA